MAGQADAGVSIDQFTVRAFPRLAANHVGVLGLHVLEALVISLGLTRWFSKFVVARPHLDLADASGESEIAANLP